MPRSKRAESGAGARATYSAGNTQPDVPVWNRLGYGTTPLRWS